MPPTPSSNDVCATTRTSPLICIASAPALRSSWTVSSSESMSTGPSTSSIVIRMPGPVTGTVPARMSRVSASLAGLRRARPARALVLDCSSSRVALEPGDLGLGALGGAGQAVEDVDQVLLAVAGVGVVDLVGPHLGDRGEADDAEQHRHDDLGPASAGAARRSSRCRPVRGSRRAGVGARVGHGVRHGRGGAGSRRRWRRCGCRGRRSRRSTAGRRRRAGRRGRRSRPRSRRC